jgi:predicted membrane-bound spermidine synthase
MQGNTILFVAVVTLLSLLNGVRAHRIFILKKRGGTWSFAVIVHLSFIIGIKMLAGML